MNERLPAGQRWVEAPRVYNIASANPVDLDAFRLVVAGLIETPLQLTWAHLLALPCARIVRDLHCVTTWSVKDVAWEGIRTQELVNQSRPSAQVRWVLATGRDGYSTSIPFEAFAHPDSLLAYRMNDEPLTHEHGHPLRLVIPSLFAWKSAKYVQKIEFMASLRRGTWEKQGYHDRGDPWRGERFRA